MNPNTYILFCIFMSILLLIFAFLAHWRRKIRTELKLIYNDIVTDTSNGDKLALQKIEQLLEYARFAEIFNIKISEFGSYKITDLENLAHIQFCKYIAFWRNEHIQVEMSYEREKLICKNEFEVGEISRLRNAVESSQKELDRLELELSEFRLSRKIGAPQCSIPEAVSL